MQPHGLQHTKLSFLRVCSSSWTLCQWLYLTISSSVISFSFCLQSFPASGSFLVSWLFLLGGQSVGASASVLPMSIQGCFISGLTGWISLQSKGLSREFSSITVQKHQFFSAQPSLLSNSVWPHRRQSRRLPRPWDSPGKSTGVGCNFLLQCMKVKNESEVAQSCLTLSDPIDSSPGGSPVPGILQARTLEWVAISFSNANAL